MADEIIKKLVSVVSESERIELQLYQNAMVKCARAYNETPSAANAKALEAAKDGLEKTVTRLENKYLQQPIFTTFKNRAQALTWLQSQGFKVAKSKFYSDIAKGLLIIESDGTVLRTAIDRYVALAQLERPAAESVAAAAKADEKTAAEIRQLNLRNEKLSFELDRERGLYELKQDAYRRSVEMLLAFFGCLRSRFYTDSTDILQKVGGAAEKAGLMRKLMGRLLDDALYEAFAEGELLVDVKEDLFDDYRD